MIVFGSREFTGQRQPTEGVYGEEAYANLDRSESQRLCWPFYLRICASTLICAATMMSVLYECLQHRYLF